MILVIKDYFEGNANTQKTYGEDMIGFSITNNHETERLTFTINGITIPVKAKQRFSGKFTPFKTVTITTTVPFEATVSTLLDETWSPTEPDNTPPADVTNLSASDVTSNSLTLLWTLSESDDVVGYDIYINGSFLSTVTGGSYEFTDLAPSTEYSFMVKAKDEANNFSSGTSITINTFPQEVEDTDPPVLTITPGGTFTENQIVSMSTNEAANIYYTTDGSDPTSGSFLYTEPLSLDNTTTLRAFAIDSTGNTSNIQTITYTKVFDGPIQEGLILHYDFTNRAGTSSNTITDKINNVVATLVGVTHDGTTDGYVDDRGLLLQKQDYVSIPSNISPFNNLIDFNAGLTIQMVSYDTNGSHWKTEDGRFTSAKDGVNLRYRKNDSTEGGVGFGSYWFRDSIGLRQSYGDFVNPIGSNALNTFTFRINSDHTGNLFINDAINDNGQQPVPSDFSSFINSMASSPLQIRRDYIALNTNSEKLVAFVIYNRPLSDDEVRNNHNFFKNSEVLVGISVQPNHVNLNPGENQLLSVQGLPDKYTDEMTLSFQSGNEGFVTVSQTGILTGIANGETSVSVTAAYQDQIFTEYITVKVGEQIVSPPSSSRIIDGMSINRKTNILPVGENYVLMGTAISSILPFDIFNDNIVLWESSDPSIARVQYGVVEGVSPGEATLTAYDSTKTYSKSFNIIVINPLSEIITEEETYYVPLDEYEISLENTNSLNTTKGIQNALQFASSNNFKKVLFPKGTYLVTPIAGSIYLPTNMIIDFNDSTINIEPSILTKSGYKMFILTNAVNTKLTRAHVYGERASTTVNESVEGCISLLIEDCLESGIESCTFNNSPGFNVITGTRQNMSFGIPTPNISLSKNNFEPGNINEAGEIDNSITNNYYRYSQFLNISGLAEYYLLGYTQGYHGYPYLRSRLYSIHFYDENYQHIVSQMYNLQFYNYPKPSNAKYAKVVIYQESPPTSGDSDFGGAVAFIRTIGMPRNCYIKNCTFENNFSTGVALCGGQGWNIDGNRFANNGGRMPGCDIDWEDGWEHMVGDVLKNNTFNSPSGVIFSAGGSLTAFNNTFNRSALTVWGRTQNWRIFNNQFNQKAPMASPSLSTQGDSVFGRNILRGIPSYSLNTLHGASANYKIWDLNNTFVN